MSYLSEVEVLTELLELIGKQQAVIDQQNKIIASLSLDNAEKENYINKGREVTM